MKLVDLGASFKRITSPGHWQEHPTLQGANGVCFLCPKCFLPGAPNPRVGVHLVICWFVGVSLSERPGPGRWIPYGKSLDDLSLKAAASSVRLTSGCKAHFFVENGSIRMAE